MVKVGSFAHHPFVTSFLTAPKSERIMPGYGQDSAGNTTGVTPNLPRASFSTYLDAMDGGHIVHFRRLGIPPPSNFHL